LCINSTARSKSRRAKDLFNTMSVVPGLWLFGAVWAPVGKRVCWIPPRCQRANTLTGRERSYTGRTKIVCAECEMSSVRNWECIGRLRWLGRFGSSMGASQWCGYLGEGMGILEHMVRIP
jgi:hypothetical protein